MSKTPSLTPLFWAAAAILLVFFSWKAAAQLQMRTDLAQNLGNITSGIFALTLIIERAVEVLVGVPRAKEGDQKDITAEHAVDQARVAETNAAHAAEQAATAQKALVQMQGMAGVQNAEAAQKAAEQAQDAQQKAEAASGKAASEKTGAAEAKKAVAEYDADTRRKAVALSFFLATIGGLLGIRLLGQLFQFPAGADGKPVSPTGWFQAFDIFLTASLMAGGSQGLHLLFSTFGSYLEDIKKSGGGK